MSLKFITFVNNFPKQEDIIGGGLIRPYETFTNLAKLGYECHIHTTDESNFQESENLKIISNPIRNKYLKHLLMPIYITYSLYNFKSLYKENSCLYIQVPLTFTVSFLWSTIVAFFLIISIRIFNIKMWASMHDLSPDHEKYVLRTNKSIKNFKKYILLIRGYSKILEQMILLKSASFITVPSFGVKKLICSRYNFRAEKVNVYRASLNPDIVGNPNIQKGELNRVGLIGSMGDVDINILLEAMKIVRQNHPEFRLILGSNEDKNPHLDQYFDFIEYVGNSKYSNFLDIVNNIDILVIPYTKDSYIDIAWQLKIPMYLGSGKPVIITETNEVNYFLGPKKICIISQPDAEKLAEYILKIHNNQIEFSNLGMGAKYFVNRELTWGITVKTLVDKLEKE